MIWAFTRPKAGRELGPLNLTQEHKSVWYGPNQRLRATPPGQRAIGPCQSRTTAHRPARRRARELGPQAISQAIARARGDFLKIGHFAPFS